MCGKQYVPSTTDKLKYRWNNYKNCQHKAERGDCQHKAERGDHRQKYLDDHFLSEDHDAWSFK